MEMASTNASLVDLRDVSDGVTATIPREEFEAALMWDEPAELFLEVARPEDGSDVDKRDVSIKWSRSDLERLLGETSGSTITLAFDRSELERALEPEVEAHGLRQKALILTVAAATATAGASSASAVVQDGGGASSAAVTPSYVAVHDEATLAARGIEPATAVGHDEATLTARGIASTSGAHDEATLVARGIDPGSLRATHDEATLAARGIEPTASGHDEATLVARGIEPVTPATTHDEATLTARGIAPVTPPDDEGWAIDVPTPNAATAAAAGGLAGLGLLITAAGFAVRRQRGMRPA